MKSPQRLLLVQRRAGKKRLTQVLGAVVAVFAVSGDACKIPIYKNVSQCMGYLKSRMFVAMPVFPPSKGEYHGCRLCCFQQVT